MYLKSSMIACTVIWKGNSEWPIIENINTLYWVRVHIHQIILLICYKKYFIALLYHGTVLHCCKCYHVKYCCHNPALHLVLILWVKSKCQIWTFIPLLVPCSMPVPIYLKILTDVLLIRNNSSSFSETSFSNSLVLQWRKSSTCVPTKPWRNLSLLSL